jgi:7-carboxy-7-deazaguanine synthase
VPDTPMCVCSVDRGCNLRCSYCDTQYACDESRLMDMEEIIQNVEAFQCPFVEITGGEPLMQKKTPVPGQKLCDKKFKVLMETNGSLNIDLVDNRCVRIMDIKCPSSGESGRNDPENIKRLTNSDEVKFVIGGREDYEFAKPVLFQIRSFHVNDMFPMWRTNRLHGYRMQSDRMILDYRQSPKNGGWE